MSKSPVSKNKKQVAFRCVVPLAVTLAGVAAALPAARPAFAQDDDAQAKKERPTVSRAKPVSANATINLVNLLVKQGVLTEEQAATLIKQAEDEAYIAREAAKDATAKADDAAKAASAASAAASPPGTKRVTYVPEIVKRELREEIKKEVMAKAKADGWVAPNVLPDWVQRIRLSGDMRVRYEGAFFPHGNAPITNYNAINTGSPFDTNSNTNPAAFAPSLNTTENRNRFRIRARLGLDADLFDGFTAGLRIGTGENNSPVSQNQSLGATGGDFSKYSVWLDRGFMKYQPVEDFAVSIGRFDNPFFSPTDLVWYKDIGFDGVAAQAKYALTDWFTPFAVGGAFPIFNTDFNLGSNNITEDITTGNVVPLSTPSHDKYLFGGQVGFFIKPIENYAFKFGAAYFDFRNVQGQLSSPCTIEFSSDTCDTDITRPSFAQKGNTYFPLRNLVAATVPPGAEPQFYGLAAKFQDVVLTGQLDIATFQPAHIVLDGEFVTNIGFDRDDVAAKAVLFGAQSNPFGPTCAGCSNTTANYAGGNMGFFTRLTVGEPEMKHLWDWNFSAAYKYLESDAVMDAFTDPDFGLGGTNLKGYIIGANLGLGPNVWLTAKWMSATQVAGAPFAVDVLQVDLNGKF